MKATDFRRTALCLAAAAALLALIGGLALATRVDSGAGAAMAPPTPAPGQPLAHIPYDPTVRQGDVIVQTAIPSCSSHCEERGERRSNLSRSEGLLRSIRRKACRIPLAMTSPCELCAPMVADCPMNCNMKSPWVR